MVFKINVFKKILSGNPSGCQTVWIHIRPNIFPGLIWVQTVCQRLSAEDKSRTGKTVRLKMFFVWFYYLKFLLSQEFFGEIKQQNLKVEIANHVFNSSPAEHQFILFSKKNTRSSVFSILNDNTCLQEGLLSVTSESMCTKYWLTA